MSSLLKGEVHWIVLYSLLKGRSTGLSCPASVIDAGLGHFRLDMEGLL